MGKRYNQINLVLKKWHIAVILFFFISCNYEHKKSHVESFDISPDKKKIIYSFGKTDTQNIYLMDLSNKKTSILFEGKGIFLNPRYSESGNLIVAIYLSEIKKMIPEFWILDIKTGNINKIKLEEGYISDYAISKDEKKIYYAQAKEYTSNSPISPKAFHNYDIYALDIKSKGNERLSYLKAYSMSEILDFDQNTLLVSMQGEVQESGLFFVNKKGKEIMSFQDLKKINIINDTLRNSSMYAQPIRLSNDSIISASSYQLVLLDLVNKKEYSLLNSNGYHYNIIRNSKEDVFFKQNDGTDSIFYFNLRSEKKIKSLLLDPKIIKYKNKPY